MNTPRAVSHPLLDTRCGTLAVIRDQTTATKTHLLSFSDTTSLSSSKKGLCRVVQRRINGRMCVLSLQSYSLWRVMIIRIAPLAYGNFEPKESRKSSQTASLGSADHPLFVVLRRNHHTMPGSSEGPFGTLSHGAGMCDSLQGPPMVFWEWRGTGIMPCKSSARHTNHLQFRRTSLIRLSLERNAGVCCRAHLDTACASRNQEHTTMSETRRYELECDCRLHVALHMCCARGASRQCERETVTRHCQTGIVTRHGSAAD